MMNFSLENPDVLFIVNREAGSGKAGAQWDRLTAQKKIQGKVFFTAGVDELSQRRTELITEDTRFVVAVGGDGTFHHVANLILKNRLQDRITLGMIPAGTGSDLSRSLGIPSISAQALDRLSGFRESQMDVIKVNLDQSSHFALNVTSFGLSGIIAADVNRKKRKRKWSYLTAAAKALMRTHPIQCTIFCDDEKQASGPVWIAAAGNARYFGNGIKITPQADPFSGKISLMAVISPSQLRLLPQVPAILAGNHKGSDQVRYFTCSKLKIIPKTEGIYPVELDGEDHLSRSMEAEIVPGALRVLVP